MSSTHKASQQESRSRRKFEEKRLRFSLRKHKRVAIFAMEISSRAQFQLFSAGKSSRPEIPQKSVRRVVRSQKDKKVAKSGNKRKIDFPGMFGNLERKGSGNYWNSLHWNSKNIPAILMKFFRVFLEFSWKNVFQDVWVSLSARLLCVRCDANYPCYQRARRRVKWQFFETICLRKF